MLPKQPGYFPLCRPTGEEVTVLPSETDYTFGKAHFSSSESVTLDKKRTKKRNLIDVLCKSTVLIIRITIVLIAPKLTYLCP